MSTSKELREQISRPTKNKIDSSAISDMLGFVGTMAVDFIKNDIKLLIQKDMRKELDGYVLALSRIVKHNIALDCVKIAYESCIEPVPKKYLRLLGETN